MSNKRTNNGVPLQQKVKQKAQKSTVWLEKLGTYLIDVSKYLLTGVLISSLMSDYESSRETIYWLGGLAAVVTLVVGLLLVNKYSKKDK